MFAVITRHICAFLMLSMCWQCHALQQAASDATKPDALEQAREELQKAEAAHPGNTVELAQALDKLNNEELTEERVVAETLDRSKREVAIAEAASGPKSRLYVTALVTLSQVLTRTSHPAEARPMGEQALEIAKSEFPDSVDVSHAAEALAGTCKALGDLPASLNAFDIAVKVDRKLANKHELADTLTSRANTRDLLGDAPGAEADLEEAALLAKEGALDALNRGILENNLGAHYAHYQQFPKAVEHYTRAMEIVTEAGGPDAPLLANFEGNLGDMYTRLGQFPPAWKNYELATRNNRHESTDWQAATLAGYGRSLAAGGDLHGGIEKGLTAARMGRETFVLQARTLPERQALEYSRHRAGGLQVALSVVAHHPELMSNDIYQEVVRSRALVAEEMARRQKNLNASNDAEVARLLDQLSQARTAVLEAENDTSGKSGKEDAIAAATAQMEKIERTLAERSAALRNDGRTTAANLDELRRSMPAHSVLISYVVYPQVAVERVDPARKFIPSCIAFVLKADSPRIGVFDLGELKPIDEMVRKMRASADAEAHSGGLDSKRQERAYREAGLGLRERIWDPLQGEIGSARLVLIVPDDVLNLVPFAALPKGNGYVVESGPVLHMLTSERDLLSTEVGIKKLGLLAMGGPAFDLGIQKPDAGATIAGLRGASVPCADFAKLHFDALPGATREVAEISVEWKRWRGGEGAELLTGKEATRERFLTDAPRSRILHVATHAFVLDKSCGNGNPLLHSGLVFAGANQNREDSIVTAQQIASLDLTGVEWAVLSACNTGNGELRDGEGVLGLERAFRVAGARTVVMTLWPVDDDVTRRYMRALYADRLRRHSGTAESAWDVARAMLLERRSAGKSTHPWYWAGFVAAGDWK